MGLDRRCAPLVLLFGLAAVAHGAIFARLADADPILISAFRTGVGALALAPLAWALRGRAVDRRALGLPAFAGLWLALHFATWISSLESTSIANSVVLVSLTPVWIALIDAVLNRRPPPAAALVSVALSVAGAAIIAFGAGGALSLSADSAVGDALALVGGVCMAAYLTVGRAAMAEDGRHRLPLPVYLSVCYGSAAFVLWAYVAAAGVPVFGLTTSAYAAMIAMGLVSQVIGHSAYNAALRVFRPAFVAVCLLGEPVVATALGYAYFGEAFGWETAAGGALALLAIYIGARAARA